MTREEIIKIIDKTLKDFAECPGGEGWFLIDGEEYNTDVGYALEGMEIFTKVLKKRLAESEDKETWNGIHAQITAPKGTFERIFNEADDDTDI